MRRRLPLLIATAVLPLAVATSIGREWPEPVTRTVLAAFGLLLAGVVEAAAQLATLRRPGSESPPTDVRPADGVVEVVSIPGARLATNPREPRFGRLEGLERSSGATAAARVRRSPTLLGRVVVWSFFLGRDGRGWSDAEISDALRSIERAAAWIEREATRYGAAVNLDVAAGYVCGVDDQPRRAADLELMSDPEGLGFFDPREEIELVAATSRIVAAQGLGDDLADLIARLNAAVRADCAVWLVHPRSAGRSMARDESELGMPGVKLAICYAREDDLPSPLIGPPSPDPATFVHELLHLFGASDKYGSPLESFPPGSVSRHEVMRLHETRLNRLRIDPLTAREIGWPDVPDPAEPEPGPRKRKDARPRRG